MTTKYIKDFVLLLKEKVTKQRQQMNEASVVDTTDNETSTSMASNPWIQSNHQQQPLNDVYSFTETSPSTKIMPTFDLQKSTSMMNTSFNNSLSPISPQPSMHEMNGPSFEEDASAMGMENSTSIDQEQIDYSSRLFLQNLSAVYTFECSVPAAKPFHMYTCTDLKPVLCAASFLYVVYSNPSMFEATFFKVTHHTYSPCICYLSICQLLPNSICIHIYLLLFFQFFGFFA